MSETISIAALAVSAVSLVSFAAAALRYLPRIARAITLWADLPAKVQANTDATAANTEAILAIRRAVSVSVNGVDSNVTGR